MTKLRKEAATFKMVCIKSSFFKVLTRKNSWPHSKSLNSAPKKRPQGKSIHCSPHEIVEDLKGLDEKSLDLEKNIDHTEDYNKIQKGKSSDDSAIEIIEGENKPENARGQRGTKAFTIFDLILQRFFLIFNV